MSFFFLLTLLFRIFLVSILISSLLISTMMLNPTTILFSCKLTCLVKCLYMNKKHIDVSIPCSHYISKYLFSSYLPNLVHCIFATLSSNISLYINYLQNFKLIFSYILVKLYNNSLYYIKHKA